MDTEPQQPEDLANLYRRAFAGYGARALWNKRDFPKDWALTRNNLGNAYAQLPTGNRSENLTARSLATRRLHTGTTPSV